MTWFRLDDSFHSHPKVIAAGNEAIGLYVRCGTHAAQHLTDGFVGKSTVLLYGSTSLADTLVRTGLWHRARGGWTIHDYLDYNPSKESVEQQRKTTAERQRRWQDARRNGVSNGSHNGVTNTDPTRPDPYNPQPPTGADPPPRRGTRIPDSFTVTPALAEWARTETPHVDTRLETAKFIDYWHSASGQRAVKRDWPATWRNWMRRAAADQPARARPPAGSGALFADARARERASHTQPIGELT